MYDSVSLGLLLHMLRVKVIVSVSFKIRDGLNLDVGLVLVCHQVQT